MTTPDHAAYLNRLKSIATAVHMKLLDEGWQGVEGRYRLRCTVGHVWSLSAQHIVHEGLTSCPECRKIRHLPPRHTEIPCNAKTGMNMTHG